MVYIEEGSEMGQALNDSIDTVYTFRNADYHDYWDLAPEGIGLEAWSEDGYLWDLAPEGTGLEAWSEHEDLYDWEERFWKD